MPDLAAVSLALLALRAVGRVMLAPGLNHIAGPSSILAGGGSIAGLLTPLAGAGVVGVMVVASITTTTATASSSSDFSSRPGYEYVMVLTVVGLVIATLGPGRGRPTSGPAGGYPPPGGACSSASGPAWAGRRLRSAGLRRPASVEQVA